jgi:hypothetical protein
MKSRRQRRLNVADGVKNQKSEKILTLPIEDDGNVYNSMHLLKMETLPAIEVNTREKQKFIQSAQEQNLHKNPTATEDLIQSKCVPSCQPTLTLQDFQHIYSIDFTENEPADMKRLANPEIIYEPSKVLSGTVELDSASPKKILIGIPRQHISLDNFFIKQRAIWTFSITSEGVCLYDLSSDMICGNLTLKVQHSSIKSIRSNAAAVAFTSMT